MALSYSPYQNNSLASPGVSGSSTFSPFAHGMAQQVVTQLPSDLVGVDGLRSPGTD